MKIVLTGGGTGGHFYPLIAIAEELNKKSVERKLVELKLYYFSNTPYGERTLFENNITYKYVPAGKQRPYFSLLNYFDYFRILFGVIVAVWKLFWIYPDLVIGKGGYASFPTLAGARILGIPVMIHESDTVPGKVNKWAAKFAKRIAISYPETSQYFPADKTAWTGQPIRRGLLHVNRDGAKEFLNLRDNIPTILVLGGSQGALAINDCIVDMLPEAIKSFQFIHQVGKDHLNDTIKRADVVLRDNELKYRYIGFGYLNDTALSMSAGIADLIISRAGSTIFEIANWGKPSIIIPIPGDISHDQEHNALAYARSGGAILLKQENLTPHVLLSEINRVLSNKTLYADMVEKTKSWGKPDAAIVIADEAINLCLQHEK